jgi:hypothetical protein
MAYDGGALGTLARVKAAIMLNGGVLTAIASWSDFEAYPGTPALFSKDLPKDAILTGNYSMHAVFCYGFSDSGATSGAGYWLCKNR